MAPLKIDKLRRSAVTAFKLNGLSLSGEAMTYLLQILSDFPPAEQSTWLDKILDRIQRLTLTTSLIGIEVMTEAIKECGSGDSLSEQDSVTIIDAFQVPRLFYDPDRKKFLPDTTTQSILAPAPEKPKVYRFRYSVLLQRTLHHHLFTPSLRAEEGLNKYDLKTVEFLVGSSSKIKKVIVLGMITQLQDDKLFLEDLTGFVELDMTECTFQNGFYTENCFVLAEGRYEDGIFSVTTVGAPPGEDAIISRNYYGLTNFFGGPPPSVDKERYRRLEEKQRGFSLIILSDLHLDNILTLKKLRVMFQGFEDLQGGLFIFMGNFLCEPTGTQKPVALRDALKNLADMILEFPTIQAKFKFVFVPGPLDPGFANILPRPPFADVITSYFKDKVPNSVFATNPCRIKYCTKEIVIFREDVMSKLVRSSLFHPTNETIPQTFVKTIIGQSHLCPLPLYTCPVYWSYDHALSLYPLPNLVVIGDQGDSFNLESSGSRFLNPGSFIRSNFSFMTYDPYDNEVEECHLPPDTD